MVGEQVPGGIEGWGGNILPTKDDIDGGTAF